MSFELRLVIVALASFAAANVVACAWTLLAARQPIGRADSAIRAAQWRRLRLRPIAISLAAMGWTTLAFVLFERRHDEPVGLILVGLAAVTVVLVTGAVVRAIVATIRSARAHREWLQSATPIDLAFAVPALAVTSAFPVVAIVGVLRPRLVIARSVLATCSPAQLRAIVAHELGHVRRHDNFVRLVLAIVPDVLGWLPASRRWIEAWHEAAEEAADDCASTLGANGRLLLAEALLRVARLVPDGRRPIVLPASALYRGENIERRVRRLLAAPEVPPSRRPMVGRRWTIAGLILAIGIASLELAHGVVELAVTFLP